MHLALTFFAAATLSVTSCKEKVEDTEEVAEEQNDEKLDGAQENAAEFLVEAAEMDLQEIQLGKLAQRSTNQDIKLHGRMMEEEHTKSSNDLKALAAQKGIALPPSLTEDGMEAYKTLNDKKLEDFDRAYIDMMVENHERAVTKFENNVQNTEDADVKAWASKTLETLRSHLEHTRALQEKIKNNK
jgi:putative membrane protein